MRKAFQVAVSSISFMILLLGLGRFPCYDSCFQKSWNFETWRVGKALKVYVWWRLYDLKVQPSGKYFQDLVRLDVPNFATFGLKLQSSGYLSWATEEGARRAAVPQKKSWREEI